MALPCRVSDGNRMCSLSYAHPFPRRDVGYETYKAHRKGPSPIEAAHFSEPTRVGMVAVKRAVFQSVASMCVHALPQE
jgi:hypothetical protein